MIPVSTPPPAGLDPADIPLWDCALAALRRSYRTGQHEVAAAIRTRSGEIHAGLHVAGSAGRTSVCAESAALASVLLACDSQVPLNEEIDTVLAVLYRPGAEGAGHVRIIAACGLCREVLNDYCPGAWNYVHDFDGAPISPAVPPPSGTGRGFTGIPDLIPGTARRVRASELLPGAATRVWFS